MTSSLTSLLLVVALWLAATIACCNGGSSSKTDNPLTPAQRAETKALQDKACDGVSRLKSAGGFTKIEAGSSGVTHAYVSRSFFNISVDAKESMMKAVALCNISLDKKDPVGAVIIHDGDSGKEIGRYSFATGLDME